MLLICGTVPIEGMLKAKYSLEVQWAEDRINRGTRTFMLKEFCAKEK